MKLLILLIFISNFCLKGFSQDVEYDTTNINFYNKFSGSWIYTKGVDTIRIHLKPHRFKYQLPDNGTIYYNDRMFGWHEYKKSNIIIESNYSFRNMILPLDDFPAGDSVSIIAGFPLDKRNNNSLEMRGSLLDITRNYDNTYLWLTLSPDGHYLHLKHSPIGEQTFSGPPGMTLPHEIILRRQ